MECRYESSPRFTLVSLSSDTSSSSSIAPSPFLSCHQMLFLFFFFFFFYTSLRYSSSIATLLTANHQCFTFLSASIYCYTNVQVGLLFTVLLFYYYCCYILLLLLFVHCYCSCCYQISANAYAISLFTNILFIIVLTLRLAFNYYMVYLG